MPTPVLKCRTQYDLSVFVPDSPGNTGKSSDVRQLTGSMGRSTPPWFSPSRLSTEVSLCCDASWPYTECCPMLTDRFPLMPKGPSWRSPLMWLHITGSYLMNVYSVVKVRLMYLRWHQYQSTRCPGCSRHTCIK